EMRMHQVGDHLGIGVGGELVANGGETRAHGVVILDDAVVHDRDAAGIVRMGVALGRHAVRRPARVADADGAREPVLQPELRQLCNPAAGAKPLQAAVDDRDAGRVVDAVLKAPQTLDEDRHDVTARYRCDDSTHTRFLLAASAALAANTAAASATKP